MMDDEKREANRLHILIASPTAPEYWGPETTETEAQVVAKNALALAEAFAKANWPGAMVEARLVPETVSSGNQSKAYDADGDRHDVIDRIDDYICRHWPEEALWQEEFDAEAYLAANPR